VNAEIPLFICHRQSPITVATAKTNAYAAIDTTANAQNRTPSTKKSASKIFLT